MGRLAAFIWRRRFRALVAAVLTLLLFGNKGFRSMIYRSIELRRLHRELASLEQEEKALTSQIERIQKDDFTMEKTVRRELDYLKPGEIEYRFPPPKSPGKPSGAAETAVPKP